MYLFVGLLRDYQERIGIQWPLLTSICIALGLNHAICCLLGIVSRIFANVTA